MHFHHLLIHDCIERGLSLIEGGSVYSADGGPTAGINTVGDSLTAIEYAVYDKKMITAEQLMYALKTNFEDMTTSPAGEEIRQILINKIPKFGNDDDFADKWSVEIADYIGGYFHKEFEGFKVRERSYTGVLFN